MKINNYFCFVIVILSVSFCIYQATKKETIYISFEDLKGYKYQFIDSTDILKTREVLITQSGDRWYQWWSIEVDTDKINKTDINDVRRIIIDSQYLIISNFGQGTKGDILKKYHLNIIKWGKDIPYILPIKNVKWLVQ